MPKPVAVGFGYRRNHSYVLAGLQYLRNWPHTRSWGDVPHAEAHYPILGQYTPSWSSGAQGGMVICSGGCKCPWEVKDWQHVPPRWPQSLSSRLHSSSRQEVHNHSFPSSPAGPMLIAKMTVITIIVVICWDWCVARS